ncbi:MAG: hypothetical protein ACI910_002568 [Oleispira sp.]
MDKDVTIDVATVCSGCEQALKPMNADRPSEILRHLKGVGSMETDSFQQIMAATLARTCHEGKRMKALNKSIAREQHSKTRMTTQG